MKLFVSNGYRIDNCEFYTCMTMQVWSSRVIVCRKSVHCNLCSCHSIFALPYVVADSGIQINDPQGVPFVKLILRERYIELHYLKVHAAVVINGRTTW